MVIVLVGCKPQEARQLPTSMKPSEHQMLSAPPMVRVQLGAGLRGDQLPTVRTDGKTSFEKPGGEVLKEVAVLGTSKIAVEGGKLRVGSFVSSEPVVMVNTGESGTFTVGTRTYRGDLEIRRHADGTVTLVNYLDLESYTRGVVASEMPKEWAEEALKAQAVASRTYAYALVQENNGKGMFDVTADFQTNQVYEGVLSETIPSDRAVQETRGLVLTYNGKPFRTYFSSTCGGHTEACGLVWKDYATIAPLTGVECNYCRDSKWYTPWEVTLSAQTIGSVLEKAGYPTAQVKDIRLSDRNNDGHMDRVELTTSSGVVEMSGNDFRLAIGSIKLKSMMCRVERVGGDFKFSGRGFGHGVGMCQYGVRGMIGQGKLWEEAVHHYYPASDIWKIYR